jgi:pimeloyl-CoA synthetase
LASLDQNKMLQGENGMVIYVDFEMIKNKKTKEKTSVINFEKIPTNSIDSMNNELEFLHDLMKNEFKV